jgi:predicted RNA-binding protein with PIN domain
MNAREQIGDNAIEKSNGLVQKRREVAVADSANQGQMLTSGADRLSEPVMTSTELSARIPKS